MQYNNLMEGLSINTDMTFSSLLQYKFTTQHDGDILTSSYKVEEYTSMLQLSRKIDAFFPVKSIRKISLTPISLTTFLLGEDEKVWGFYTISDVSPDVEYDYVPLSSYVVKKGKYQLLFIMDAALLEGLDEKFTQEFPSTKQSMINWYYTKDGRQQIEEIPVTDSNTIHDEYYPFITIGVKKLIDQYFASNESVLLLLGPPGTGKTSLVRHMICSRNFHACMTYDKNVFTNDKFYLDYLLRNNNDLMIVEDADILLEDRETAGNEQMAKLLNIGDGLVKMPNKKMIFTTNLTDPRKIDKAIMRPGRCFSVINFRNLTPDEAQAAADKAGLKLIPGKKEYSLADMFSQREETLKIRKFGFV